MLSETLKQKSKQSEVSRDSSKDTSLAPGDPRYSMLPKSHKNSLLYKITGLQLPHSMTLKTSEKPNSTSPAQNPLIRKPGASPHLPNPQKSPNIPRGSKISSPLPTISTESIPSSTSSTPNPSYYSKYTPVLSPSSNPSLIPLSSKSITHLKSDPVGKNTQKLQKTENSKSNPKKPKNFKKPAERQSFQQALTKIDRGKIIFVDQILGKRSKIGKEHDLTVKSQNLDNSEEKFLSDKENFILKLVTKKVPKKKVMNIPKILFPNQVMNAYKKQKVKAKVKQRQGKSVQIFIDEVLSNNEMMDNHEHQIMRNIQMSKRYNDGDICRRNIFTPQNLR